MMMMTKVKIRVGVRVKIKRYPDRCYAVVEGRRRGPCGHDKTTAIARYMRSGLIASAGTDKHHGI